MRKLLLIVLAAVVLPIVCIVVAGERATKSERRQPNPRPTPSRAAAVPDASPAELALVEACGPKPGRSSWDGEVRGLQRVLKRHAHDPGELDVENCTDPLPASERFCWVFSCDVRGKNAFGAKVLNRRVFTQKKGEFFALDGDEAEAAAKEAMRVKLGLPDDRPKAKR